MPTQFTCWSFAMQEYGEALDAACRLENPSMIRNEKKPPSVEYELTQCLFMVFSALTYEAPLNSFFFSVTLDSIPVLSSRIDLIEAIVQGKCQPMTIEEYLMYKYPDVAQVARSRNEINIRQIIAVCAKIISPGMLESDMSIVMGKLRQRKNYAKVP